MYCKADFKSIAKCKKWLCAAVFVLLFKVARRAANPVLQSRCNGFSAPPQNIPKTTKTGRKSVGFLILTWVLKYTRSHRFPPQKHPKNGFVMRFAGKNSFFQLRARDFSFYMNTHTRNCRLKERRSIVLQRGISQQDRYFLTEILYVEASNHSSIVYTYDKTQSYALTFAQMEKLLPAEDFKKCHRGYIVNLHAVKGLRRNSITLVDGREILVSTTYFQSVKDALIALRGGQ